MGTGDESFVFESPSRKTRNVNQPNSRQSCAFRFRTESKSDERRLRGWLGGCTRRANGVACRARDKDRERGSRADSNWNAPQTGEQQQRQPVSLSRLLQYSCPKRNTGELAKFTTNKEQAGGPKVDKPRQAARFLLADITQR